MVILAILALITMPIMSTVTEQTRQQAFIDTGLLTVTLPGSVEIIGASAFINNTGLSQINVVGKSSSADFTSLGASWNGTCATINYLGN